MKTKVILYLGLSSLLYQCGPKSVTQVFIPKQANEFVWVYKPGGDHFFGPDTEHLKEGEWYDEWVPNDHTFVKGTDGKWHLFGITHPLVETDPLSAGIHEGENASFHAVSADTEFKKTIKEHHYKDLAKVLPQRNAPMRLRQTMLPISSERRDFTTWSMAQAHCVWQCPPIWRNGT